MSRLIAAAPSEPIDAAECLSRAESSGVDPRDEAGLESLAGTLAALAGNADFLSRAICGALDRGGTDDAGGWGAQVILLAPPGARFVLRASLWPGTADAILADSGPAAFFYGIAHDHDFGFLTCGYAGPGYRSDEWEVDADRMTGTPGERAILRPLGQHRLRRGDVRLYRAHRDVHAQMPPERFSISLNLLARGDAMPWLGQYRYDVDRGCVASTLGTLPAEILFDLSVAVAGTDGIERIMAAGRAHRSTRTRIAAWRTLAKHAPDRLRPLLRRADIAADRLLSAHARVIASEMDRVPG